MSKPLPTRTDLGTLYASLQEGAKAEREAREAKRLEALEAERKRQEAETARMQDLLNKAAEHDLKRRKEAAEAQAAAETAEAERAIREKAYTAHHVETEEQEKTRKAWTDVLNGMHLSGE